jgi:hypothetical protein
MQNITRLPLPNPWQICHLKTMPNSQTRMVVRLLKIATPQTRMVVSLQDPAL